MSAQVTLCPFPLVALHIGGRGEYKFVSPEPWAEAQDSPPRTEVATALVTAIQGLAETGPGAVLPSARDEADFDPLASLSPVHGVPRPPLPELGSFPLHPTTHGNACRRPGDHHVPRLPQPARRGPGTAHCGRASPSQSTARPRSPPALSTTGPATRPLAPALPPTCTAEATAGLPRTGPSCPPTAQPQPRGGLHCARLRTLEEPPDSARGLIRVS